MKNHYDNSDRLEAVTDKEWCEALDELTTYLTWRLRCKTLKGAHSERVLGMPAFDYYQEEAVVKLIEGAWKWQERYTLGQQLTQIATNLITKQVERYQRAHPWVKDPEFEVYEDENVNDNENDGEGDLSTAVEMTNRCGRDDGEEVFARRKPEFVEIRDPERLPDIEDPSTGSGQARQEELDETYDQVFALVADDEELTLYVEAIVYCNKFKELPEYLGIPIKKVYRLQEKLMRRIKRWRAAQVQGSGFKVQE